MVLYGCMCVLLVSDMLYIHGTGSARIYIYMCVCVCVCEYIYIHTKYYISKSFQCQWPSLLTTQEEIIWAPWSPWLRFLTAYVYVYIYILYLVAAAWVGTQCCKTVFHQYDQSSLALKQEKQATQSVRMLKRLVHSNDNTCSRNMKKLTHHPAPKCADQIPRLQPGAHLNALAAAENERK